MVREVVHAFGHVGMPFVLARKFYAKWWQRAGLIILAMNLIDVDHLLADPVFDSERCSIGFHPLHSGIAIFTYMVMVVFPKTRIFAVGLLLHIVVDMIDCWFILG